MNRKEFNQRVATPLRKIFTSTVAQAVRPKAEPSQYKELTMACNTTLGSVKHRRDFDYAMLRKIAVLEGFLSIEIRERRAHSTKAVLELIPQIATRVLSLSTEEQKLALRHILAHFKISIEYKTAPKTKQRALTNI